MKLKSSPKWRQLRGSGIPQSDSQRRGLGWRSRQLCDSFKRSTREQERPEDKALGPFNVVNHTLLYSILTILLVNGHTAAGGSADWCHPCGSLFGCGQDISNSRPQCNICIHAMGWVAKCMADFSHLHKIFILFACVMH